MRHPANLEHYSASSRLVVPDSARVNVPISVDFTAYGGGCTARATSELSETALGVVIYTFQDDYIPRANQACTDELRVERHFIPVRFTSVGSARVRVVGRRMPGATSVVLERTVTVTP